jgi:HD-GYP domain-containing protein (c-di-GMP phosphodiesterase class II)
MSLHRPDRRTLEEINPLWDGKLLLRAAGLCLTLAAVLFTIFQPAPLQKIDLLLYDLMVAERAAPPQSKAPLMVRIDEESLAKLGQWPWPRYRMAELVEKLQDLGASVIVLDLLMSEVDRTAPEVIQEERRRDLSVARNSEAASKPDSNSQRLASALAKAPTVVGYYLDFNSAGMASRRQASPALPAGMVVIRSNGGGQWHSLKPAGVIRSLPVLADAAGAEGFTNALSDIDGTLRRVPLLFPVDGKERPSLALSALLLSSQQRQVRMLSDNSESTMQWGSHTIPLDSAGNMLLDYRGTSHQYLSAAAVFEGALQPDSLRGKIVIVGTWAKGLGDWHRTPSGTFLNGLDIHATIIDNILSDSYIARPDWSRGAELIAVLIAGVAFSLVLSQAGFAVSLLSVFAGSAGLYWIARQLLVFQGLHLSPLMPMLTLVLLIIVLGLLRFGIETRKVRIRTRDLFEAQDEIIFSLSVLAESRDKDTGRHILRTQRYVEMLARQLSTTPKYAHLSNYDVELFAKSAPLHDIGKVGIPDSILQKPGKLTEEEYTIMKTHPLIGAETLGRIMRSTGQPEKQHFLTYARDMIEAHHERWDGEGYPHKLKGDAIPLAGRLMALADVYDALISKRVYKKEFPHSEVCDYIVEKSGSQFDPDLVAAFMARNEDFYKIAQQYADVPADEAQHA